MNSIASNIKNAANAANATITNMRNSANVTVTNMRNTLVSEQRTDSFYYVLIISMFVVLGLITYFFQPLKSLLQDTFYSVKRMIYPDPPIPPEVSETPEQSEKPLSPQDRPSGLPGATEADPLTQVGANIPKREEVFHIHKNIYTYSDAAAVCRAFGADLATESQVNDAYKKGADWCSYGWIKGQNAVFPTQQSTYDSLQKGSAEQRTACGKPGINGGYFDNPDLRFGVTCYGMKPEKSSTDALTNNVIELPPSTDEIEFEKKVQKFREQLDTTTVNPWNRSTWSSS
jgi:hypothetical protein